MTAEALLLLASAACCVAFYAVSGVAALVRRPLTPPELPATSDVGAQTPAVANLLANAGRVSPDAVPGTLLDLAARRVIDIDEPSPHVYEIRFGPKPPSDLTAYERRVYDLVRSKMSGGAVPAAALTPGTAGQARSWHRGFDGEVAAEARRLGLTKRRWPPQLLTVLGLFLFGAFMLVAFAGNASDEHGGWWAATLAFTLATVWFSSKVMTDESQLVTPEGLPSQARWVALRKYLHEDELFPTLPPTAVSVRERYLAYGAALGVAAGAVRAIPMGAESDRRAWSSYGGRWRQVTVYYPRVWPPAFGASPGESIWRGLRLAAGGAGALWLYGRLLPNLSFAHSSDQLTRDFSAAVTLLAAMAVVVAGTGLWLLLAGAVSALGSREVTGDAVRLRQFGDEDGRCYLAVDDGTRDRIRAWKIRPGLYRSITEYSTVTVSVTPLLSYVRTVQRVKAAAQPAPVAART